jgi:two-component system, cell cycle response regulator
MYLARPEEAVNAADAIIAAADHESRNQFAWGFLIRALARCRSLELKFDADAVRADFAAAREHFAALADARGVRMTTLVDGAIAMRQGNWPVARREFELLIGKFDLNQLDVDNFYIYFGLATAYVYEGRLEESLRFGYAGMHLASQLELQPEFAAIALPLGVALMAAKDLDEANSLLDSAITAADAIGSAVLAKTLRNNRAIALRRFGRLDEALALILKIEHDKTVMVGGQHFLHYNAAELYLKRGEVDAAASHFDMARRILEAQGASGLDLIKLHYVEGAIAAHRGRLVDAAAAFTRVDRMLPDVSALRFNDRAEFYDEYADVLARLGRMQEAFESQRKSSQHYRASIDVVNRVRRFSNQVRQEIHRVSADLERESSERRKLQAHNAKLREQVGAAIGKAEKFRDQANLDALTNIFNRRYLDEALPKLLSLSQFAATPFSLVMIDLDHFKQINDRYGHLMGDEVLREFGKLAQNSLRGSDIIGRYGGEEFCLALIGCGPQAAHDRVDQLLARFRQNVFQREGQSIDGLTFSAGIAVYPEDGVSLTQLTLKADARLYKAKAAGRAQALAVDRVAG